MAEVSPENRAFAEAAYEAINSGDLDGFLSVCAEDVEFTSLVAEAEGAVFRGHDGVRAWWETVRGGFKDVHWNVLEMHQPADDCIVAHFRMAGVLGGVPLEQPMWQAVRRRDDGKIRWWGIFRTEGEALAAVGAVTR
jgi:ketosteroid isomerase-like protein